MARPRPPELMRLQNRAAILASIREHGPISRADLARQLHLNPATVTRITRALLDEGIIVETGEGENKGVGRKPVLLSFNHRARLVIGIQQSKSHITGAVADLAATILTRRTHLIEPIQPIGNLSKLLDDLLGADPSYRPRLTAIYIGLTNETNYQPEHPPLLDVPTITANVAELAARAEARWGAARGNTKFVLFYLGATGRACVYMDGKISVGGLGLGKDAKPLAEKLCDNGLLTMAASAMESDKSGALRAITGRRPLSGRMIFEAARQQDPTALNIIESIAAEIAFSACWFANALSLSHILLGGPWGSAHDILLPLINRALQETCPAPPSVIPAELGDEAPLLGAIDAAVEVAGATV